MNEDRLTVIDSTQLKENLEHTLESLVAQFGAQARIRLDRVWGNTNVFVDVERPETDAEMTARLKREDAARRAARQSHAS